MADITIHKPATVSLVVVDGEPPVDQSAEVAALAAQVTALQAEVAALAAKIAAAQAALA